MLLDNLPSEWAICTISDVAAVNPKKIVADADLVTGFVPMSHAPIDFHSKLQFEEKAWGEIQKAYTNFQNGDVIFAKVTPCFENGKAAIVDGLPNGIGAGSSEFYVLRPHTDAVLNRILFALIKTHSFAQNGAANMTGAVGLRRVPRAFVEGFKFPLSPLAEQKVIAEKLNTLLAQVDNTKVRLERIPEILKRFRQSVLAAAVSGKLTEEWRGNPALKFNQPSITIGPEFDSAPQSWEWKKLVDLAQLESGHTPRKSVEEYWKDGDVYWISLQDIREANGQIIQDTKFKPTSLGIENSSARLLPAGTVCYCRDISVGYVTIMGRSMATTQHFANWICGTELNNKFLMYSFMAAKDHLLISGQGTTVKTIYMPALKELRILVPPENEQTEIVRRVEELFAFADRIEHAAQAALSRVNNLTQSILAKAFRGELTADWRAANPELISGENSAEALLARIMAERVTLSKKTKAKA